MVVVSTGLGREEWACGAGSAEQELGLSVRGVGLSVRGAGLSVHGVGLSVLELRLSVRGVGLSTFREREGPEAWGIGTGQDRKVDESRRGQVWRDWVRHPRVALESELAPGAETKAPCPLHILTPACPSLSAPPGTVKLLHFGCIS